MARRIRLLSSATSSFSGGSAFDKKSLFRPLEESSSSYFKELLHPPKYSLSIPVDPIIRKKNSLIAANGFLGIILMIVELEVGWDGSQLVDTWFANIIKICLSLNTFLLCYQIFDYYWLQARLKRRSWGWLDVQTGGVGLSIAAILRNTSLSTKFWLEIFICSIHPIPFVLDAKVGYLMFLRLYLLGRVIRDYSNIYVRRNFILNSKAFPSYSSVPPTFDWGLCIKTLYYLWPARFLTICTLAVIGIFGYGVYIFERESEPTRYTWLVGFYLSFISLITGWPTDTYEDYLPNTFWGRACCMASTTVGLVLLSEVIDASARAIRNKPHQEYAVNWLARKELQNIEAHLAATIIQVIWRHHKWRKHNISPEEIAHGKRIEVDYCNKIMNLMKDFRSTQKKKKLLAEIDGRRKEDKLLLQRIKFLQQSERELLDKVATLERLQIDLIQKFDELLLERSPTTRK
eukprot:TRINITY_DN8361_c0_g1_i1.p1 TRINITY_DN8361_c0_g1~~TRINITY_DN8361_c0_g1_i1.p1  ORF type:complete len:460 (+),score=74.44 TRINITY_DN8361_c0_g1_i1:135-1514(+)